MIPESALSFSERPALIAEIMAALVTVYGGQGEDFRADAEVLAALVGPGPLTVTPRQSVDEFHTVYSIGEATVGIGEGCEDEPALPQLLGTTTERTVEGVGRWTR